MRARSRPLRNDASHRSLTSSGDISPVRRWRGSGRSRPGSSPAPCRPSSNPFPPCPASPDRSEEHTSELQSLMRTSYAVFCLKKKKETSTITHHVLTVCTSNDKFDQKPT